MLGGGRLRGREFCGAREHVCVRVCLRGPARRPALLPPPPGDSGRICASLRSESPPIPCSRPPQREPLRSQVLAERERCGDALPCAWKCWADGGSSKAWASAF